MDQYFIDLRKFEDNDKFAIVTIGLSDIFVYLSCNEIDNIKISSVCWRSTIKWPYYANWIYLVSYSS